VLCGLHAGERLGQQLLPPVAARTNRNGRHGLVEFRHGQAVRPCSARLRRDIADERVPLSVK